MVSLFFPNNNVFKLLPTHFGFQGRPQQASKMQVLVVPPHNLGYDSDYSVLLCGWFRVFNKKAFEHIPKSFPLIWASRGAPKKLPRGSQKHRSTQVVPRSSQGEQEAPRNSQEHAQGTPRATHEDTKRSQEHPKSTQETARATQEALKGSQGHPKRAQDHPKSIPQGFESLPSESQDHRRYAC